MSNLNVEEAKSAIRDILQEAKRDGSVLTVRIVLQKVGERLGLEEKDLMEGKHKKVLKTYIKEQSKARPDLNEAARDDENAGDHSVSAKPKTITKRKSDTKPSTSPRRPEFDDAEKRQRRKKSKALPTESDDGESDAKPASKKQKGGNFKSKDIIDTDSEEASSSEKVSKPKPKPPAFATSLKRKLNEAVGESEPSLSTFKSKEQTGRDAESGSELSVLIDDPPSKKSKTKKSKSEDKKAPRRKKSESTLSPDEEQIKKLKSFVVACGVRKVWSKELKDCETPASQIMHLRKLLSNLGMKGRFSLEQAKNIRAKRELEQELEDVKDFANRYTRDRRKRSPSPGKERAENGDGDDSEATEDVVPRQRKNAHASILAFLGDQSESDGQ